MGPPNVGLRTAESSSFSGVVEQGVLSTRTVGLRTCANAVADHVPRLLVHPPTVVGALADGAIVIFEQAVFRGRAGIPAVQALPGVATTTTVPTFGGAVVRALLSSEGASGGGALSCHGLVA